MGETEEKLTTICSKLSFSVGNQMVINSSIYFFTTTMIHNRKGDWWLSIFHDWHLIRGDLYPRLSLGKRMCFVEEVLRTWLRSKIKEMTKRTCIFRLSLGCVELSLDCHKLLLSFLIFDICGISPLLPKHGKWMITRVDVVGQPSNDKRDHINYESHI